ncbi:ABC transporter ATP-binding protein [Leekyejoonella antrihumi]|uniref:ABC transporter ATP-binding protein n=1 Tax=Leekyejoonella antrihumi TaxID=1660198 RepID=A0A563DXF9_9MICO|nr:ABC transporter ATP-binding protein [Leekyejoonella antrihumi]TWP34978.1 ABC transporter ATP-binding protein [Leekyejoonella antrihumi]
MTENMKRPLLAVEDLTLALGLGGEEFNALEHLSFALREGEARGLVGESGSGKSLTLRAILGLLPPNAVVKSGTMTFDGEEFDLARQSNRSERRRIERLRGSGISMIFQEPSVALNPVIPVGEQIVDAVLRRDHMTKKHAREYAIHLMELVGIHDATAKVDAYPFELSGGLKQRVMIAAAVAGKPRLILCDEPTTALDVTVQKQILSVFTHLRDELGAGLLYVTHDLAVVAQLCDSVTVLYSGNVMESSSDLRAVFDHPRHPYTEALLRSTPDVDQIGRRLYSIPGSAPSLDERMVGCPFAPRCEYRQDDCGQQRIPDLSKTPERTVHCLHQVEKRTLDAVLEEETS